MMKTMLGRFTWPTGLGSGEGIRQLEQHGLLAVQAVFGLGEDQRALVVQKLTFDLIAVVGGEAVQDFQV